MAVSTYIHDLLFRYECVILPGFGAFIAQEHSAQYNSTTQEFLPPKKTVSFNRRLVKNDGLLANYLAEAENIEYEAAVEKLHHFVGELQTVLEQNNHAVLENIGTLTLTADNKIAFEPELKTNFLKEAFGLQKIEATTILREAYKEQVIAIEAKTPVAFTPERRASRWLKYAAIAVVAVGISGAAGLNVYSDQVSDHNMAEQQKAVSHLENQIQRATFVIDNPLPAITLKVSKQSGNHHIVAGAYREAENAAKAVAELKEKGYNARQIEANRFGLHQVLYSSHESRRDAINELYKIQKSNPGAWLLVEEL